MAAAQAWILKQVQDDEPYAPLSLALTKVGASAADKVTGSRGSHFRGNEGGGGYDKE